MSRVLFVHNNFPGQFGFLAEALIVRGDQCMALGAAGARPVPGVETHRWSTARGSAKGLFGPATRAEADMIRGYAAADAAVRIRAGGFEPDLVIGHPGWGETLFLHDVFPRARHITYAEFFYRGRDSDVDFDPEWVELTLHESFRLHAKSATLALAYAQADALVSPTRFQASMLPPRLRHGLEVIHEGVRTDRILPRPEATLTLADGRVLDRSTPVVTFVSRTLEPMRGFHVFMRALPAILRDNPDAQVLVIGVDGRPGYGVVPPKGASWKAHMLKELGEGLDLSRVHFTGLAPYAWYQDALAVSSAHVYLTYPFTLSWSLIEAMASGCLIIGSRTPPVLDALDGESGVLVDFFDGEGLAAAVTAACREPQRFEPRRRAARATAVARFDQAGVCLPAWLTLVDRVLAMGPA